MPIRTRVETVIFRRPFMLAGLAGAQPAGAYTVEISEERPESAPFASWRTRSTVIRLQPEPGLTRSVSVDPGDLDVALTQDGVPVEIRHESVARHVRRVGKKAFFDIMRSEKNARVAVEDPIRVRRSD